MKSLIRHILAVPIWDTQCGAKILTRSLAEETFNRPFRTKWLFDVELLMRIGRHRLSRLVMEHPLHTWSDVPGTKLDVHAFTDLFKLLAHRREEL